jgi:hypothetical protein
MTEQEVGKPKNLGIKYGGQIGLNTSINDFSMFVSTFS